MNPIYDCPLSVKEKDMAELIQAWEHPALLLSVDKSVIAVNAALEGAGFRKGGSLSGLFTLDELCMLNGMEIGELISLQLECDDTLYADAARFDGYYLVALGFRSFSVAEEWANVPDGAERWIDKTEKNAIAVESGARSRREQAVEEKHTEQNDYRLKRKSLDAYLAPDDVEDEDSGYFDPAKATELVAFTVAKKTQRREAEFFCRAAPAEYLSNGDQEGYCSALGILMIVSAKSADNGVVRVAGETYGKMYEVSVSFGNDDLCLRLEAGDLSDDEWEVYLGEGTAELFALCRGTSWTLEFIGEKGGVVRGVLRLRLSDRKAYVFLRPLITKATYRAVVKKISAVKWTSK